RGQAGHHGAGEMLRNGLDDLGLEWCAAAGHRLPELPTVRVPENVDSAEVRGRLLNEYGIEIGAGAGPYAKSVWRIGLMGHNAQPATVAMLLGAFRQILGK